MTEERREASANGDVVDDRAPLLSFPPRNSSTQNASNAEDDAKDGAGGTSAIATFFNFSKASIGSGSFALPWAIRQSGVLIGSFGLILLGIVSVYTMQLMLECKNFATKGLSTIKKKEFTFNDVGRTAFGFPGKFAVDLNVIFCNLGVCAGYIIFIASNLQWSTTCFAHREHDSFTRWEVYAYLIPILIVLTFLPSFKYLAYAAYIGIVFLVIAMITVYWYGIKHKDFVAVKNHEVIYAELSFTRIPKFFGVAAYLFCVHSMVIPLESVMKKPQQMKYVLDAACVVVVGVNLPFALYGYLLFGNEVNGYCFENIPGGTFENIVRLMLSMELTLTFPIVFKPATEVVEEWIDSIYGKAKNKYNLSPCLVTLFENNLVRYPLICVVRSLLVLLSWSVALLIPQFQLCVAFIGGFATTTLAFIMPPLFHLKLMWSNTEWSRRILLIVIMIFGIVTTLITTAVNIDAIVEASSSSIDITC